MRGFVVTLALAVFMLPSVSQAEPRPRVWLRRVTLVASCAASAWDVQTTASAIGRGGRESNNMFADPLGRVRWGRMIGFKAALCGGMAAGQEIKAFNSNRSGGSRPFRDDAWIGINTGLAARFIFASLRNRSVLQSKP